MENKIPTAEEFLIRQGCQRMNCEGEDCDYFEDVQPKDLIEFAKLHVEAQAKAIVNNINPETGKYIISGKEQILNAYSLTNIK